MMFKDNFDTETNLFIGLFDAIPFNVYVADIANHDLIFVNNKLREGTALKPGQKCYQAIYHQQQPCAHCPISKLLDASGQPTGETLVSELFNDADDNWYQLQDKCIHWPDGRIAKYSIGIDLTEQKKAQNQLAEAHAELALKSKILEALSVTDPLTQLYNRLKIDQVIHNEIARSNRYKVPLSVVLMDLDKFKTVNDTYGHGVGDQVLKQTADILRSELREQDFAARWGGEEFVIICPQTNLENAQIVADKLREKLAESTFPVVNHVTGSFGVASFSETESVNELMDRADKGLYLAKREGRNRVGVVTR